MKIDKTQRYSLELKKTENRYILNTYNNLDVKILSFNFAKNELIEILTIGRIIKKINNTDVDCRIRTIRISRNIVVIFEDPEIKKFFIEVHCSDKKWRELFTDVKDDVKL
jgi:hypothetical protein